MPDNDQCNYLVILATYNERENLPSLVEALLQTDLPIHLLVVDDDSPDGTGEWATEHAAKNASVHAFIRKNERGLGSATITGIKWGLDREYDLIATMDADHSHDPTALHQMISTMRREIDVDLLLGSRYVPGGKIEGWAFHRRVISRLLNWFVRIWLWLPTHDNSGACRVYRAKAFDNLHLDDIKSGGYAYLEEIVYLFKRNGKQLQEFPITFRERVHGSSKLSLRQTTKALWDLFKLKFRR